MHKLLTAMCPSVVQVFLSHQALAQEQVDAQRAVIFSTMAEAILSTAILVNDYSSEISIEKVPWEAKVSSKSFDVTLNFYIKGEVYPVSISGFLWSDGKEDIEVTYAGSGVIESEPVAINGRAQWLYNQDGKDFQSTDYQQVVRVGEHSWWGWIVGAEAVFGASVSIIATLPTIPATGGAAIAPGLLGAVGAANLMITFSKTVRDSINSDVPVALAPLPERPTLDLARSEGNNLMTVAVSPTGELRGWGGGSVQLFGYYSIADHSVSGTVEKYN